MKQTRQAVRAVKQSILLRCLWPVATVNRMESQTVPKQKLDQKHSHSQLLSLILDIHGSYLLSDFFDLKGASLR
jgi:hypothetical protein